MASVSPRDKLLDDESVSGNNNPKTFLAPRAFTHNAAETELSIQPDMATTNPRRFK